MDEILRRINHFLEKKSLLPVLRFIAITIIIHFSWIIWEEVLLFSPVRNEIDTIATYLINLIFDASVKILSVISNEEIISGNDNLTILLGEHGSLQIYKGCGGLKQMMQFAGLILVLKGKIIKKSVFIPFGIGIVFIISILRIVGLSLIIMHIPIIWDISHDHIFRIMFYVVIFYLWVIWEHINRIEPRPHK